MHTADQTQQTIRFLEALIGDSRLERVTFRLQDGTLWPDATPRPATLVFRHPEALLRMFGRGTEAALAEAYLRDDFDVSGDMESALELAEVLATRFDGNWLGLAKAWLSLRRLRGREGLRRRPRLAGAEHSQDRDRRAVRFHYDVSNDFFQLWLDSRMLYSCAYFEDAANTLEAAQTAKLHHLCHKLRLRPSDRLLDIGCGWGGLATFAAQHYGARVLGVTLSERQAELAKRRVAEAGLANAVTIELRDYREVVAREPFDAIVSVGMSEHVGRRELPNYFAKAASLLRPAGVFLNHAIGEGVRPRVSHGPSFIQEHVFPDSDIPPVPLVLGAAESAGLEVRDVENLREHYMLTLRHWVRRLEAGHEAALAFVDEPAFRVWRLYMAASAHGFDRGHLAVYQVLLSKPDPSGRAHLPLTRADWYRPAA